MFRREEDCLGCLPCRSRPRLQKVFAIIHELIKSTAIAVHASSVTAAEATILVGKTGCIQVYLYIRRDVALHAAANPPLRVVVWGRFRNGSSAHFEGFNHLRNASRLIRASFEVCHPKAKSASTGLAGMSFFAFCGTASFLEGSRGGGLPWRPLKWNPERWV